MATVNNVSVAETPAANPSSLKPSGHIPSLDGLRAISILLVLLGHLSGTAGFINFDPGIGDFAHLGVVVFFVISGFLITSLLYTEHSKRGCVSLKLFYARRSLRILPAAYCYLLCVVIFWQLGVFNLNASDVLHSITYTVNYMPHPSWQIGHLWSLSVEEQFYLIWPVLFVILGPRRGIWATAIAILAGPPARAFAWIMLRGSPYHDLNMFPMVADSLATGCLLAQSRTWLESQKWYIRLFLPSYSILILILILLANRYMGYGLVEVFGKSVVNLGLAVLVHRSVYLWRDGIGRILNSKGVAFVGVLSYSLYLWQQPFLNRNSSAWMARFPANLILTILVAMSSYLLLEKPLMGLRHRLRD
jgi:peptidoglycan/LPS O-acetylase OafA/YrhL